MGKHHSDRFVTLVDDAKTRIDEITPDEYEHITEAALESAQELINKNTFKN